MKKVRTCVLCDEPVKQSSVCIDCEEEAFNIVQELYEQEYMNDLLYDKMRDKL